MTVAVIRNTPARFGGFLNSCMFEMAPGVFVAPKLSRNARERIWNVLLGWSESLPSDAGILICWRESSAPSGLEIRTIGWPKKELIDYEGVWLSYQALTKQRSSSDLESGSS